MTTAEGWYAVNLKGGPIGQSPFAAGFKSELNGFRHDSGERTNLHGEACNNVGVLAPGVFLGDFDEILGQAEFVQKKIQQSCKPEHPGCAVNLNEKLT